MNRKTHNITYMLKFSAPSNFPELETLISKGADEGRCMDVVALLFLPGILGLEIDTNGRSDDSETAT